MFSSLSFLIHFIGTHICRIILQFITQPFSSRLHKDYYDLLKRLLESRSRKLWSERTTATPSLCLRIERKAFLPAEFRTHTGGFVYPGWLCTPLCNQQKEPNSSHPTLTVYIPLSSEEKLLLVSKTAYTNHLSFTKSRGEQGSRGVGVLKNSGNLLPGWQGFLLVSRQ